MPGFELKTAILTPDMDLTHDEFRDMTLEWLQSTSDSTSTKTAFFIDVKNPDDFLHMLFPQAALDEHPHLPEDIDIGKALASQVLTIVNDEIHTLVQQQLHGVTAGDAPGQSGLTIEQLTIIADQIRGLINYQGPTEETVKMWARQAVADSWSADVATVERLRQDMAALQSDLDDVPAEATPALTVSDPITGEPVTTPVTLYDTPDGEDLPSILPPNATDLALALEQMWAQRLAGITTPIKHLWNPDTCPEEFLPWLAWSLGVRVWDHGWPIALKRNVVRNSIPILKIGGTPPAVRRALETLGVDVDLKEWFDLDQDGNRMGEFPDIFVEVSTTDLFGAGFRPDPSFTALVNRVLERVKPVRAGVTLTVVDRIVTHLGLHIGGRTTTKSDHHLDPQIPVDRGAAAATYRVGAFTKTRSTAALNPSLPVDRGNGVIAQRYGARSQAVHRAVLTLEIAEAA